MADLRYISIEPSLILYGIDGTIKYRFENGEYIGPKIEAYDATAKEWILHPKISLKDLRGTGGIPVNGGTTVPANDYCPEEVCGLGSLNGKSHSDTASNWDVAGTGKDTMPSGDALTTLYHGYKGAFYLAEQLDAVITTGVEATIEGNYVVKSGVAEYESVQYTVGEVIKVGTEKTIIGIGGTAVVALQLPDALANLLPDQMTKENFKIKHLMVGDETLDYFLYSSGGYTPQPIGWTR